MILVKMKTPASAIPPRLAETVACEFGARGSAWLASLPDLLRDVAARFSLRLGQPFADLSFNYVARAEMTDGTPVVLKLGVPHRDLLTEAETLRLYDGEGMVRLLGGSPAEGILILERLEPATPLRQVADEDEAARIAASVMRQLRRPPPEDCSLPTVAEWGRGFSRLRARFGGTTGPFPLAMVDAAERTFFDLADSTQERVVLHGDLHHWNICAATRQPWLAIDPKGVVGDPAYEVGAFLRNPLPDLLAVAGPERVLRRRVQLFSEHLGLTRERLVGWGFAQAVLSAWWSYEGNSNDWQEGMRIAGLIRLSL